MSEQNGTTALAKTDDLNQDARDALVATAGTGMSLRLTLQPRTIEEVKTVAAWAAKVGFAGIVSPEDAALRIMAGAELGMTATQAMRSIYMVHGRQSLDASFMQALCEQAPECEYFECTDTSETSATYATKKRGRPEKTYTFTLDEAKRAGIVKADSNWAKWPREMLRARAKSALARMVYPGRLVGLYSREEMYDGDVITVEAEPVKSAEPKVQVAPRDATAEAQAIAIQIREASTAEEKAAARKAIDTFARDVGEPHASQLKALYNEVHAAKPKKAPEPPKSEPKATREPGDDA